jgi:4-amino-4-deoxychorismate lyase
MPVLSDASLRDGIRLFPCRTRLALQPALAGIKHLNRLEQVLARGEWNDASCAEGLMLDMEGRLACATAANLFVVVDDDVLTT